MLSKSGINFLRVRCCHMFYLCEWWREEHVRGPAPICSSITHRVKRFFIANFHISELGCDSMHIQGGRRIELAQSTLLTVFKSRMKHLNGLLLYSAFIQSPVQLTLFHSPIHSHTDSSSGAIGGEVSSSRRLRHAQGGVEPATLRLPSPPEPMSSQFICTLHLFTHKLFLSLWHQ